MTTTPAIPAHRSPLRQASRHTAAVAVALALNAALVLFMVTWLGRSRSARPATVLAVPMVVRQLEPEEMEIAEGPAAEPLPTPPAVEPPLPPPEVLEISALDLPAPVPAPLLVDAPATAASSLAVPAYEAEALPAAPAPLPAGGTGEAEARPGPVRPSRGPVLMRPPDMSEYYPRRARMQGLTGTSHIRLTVDADGRVTDVEVLDSSPPGAFEQAALRVGRSLAFRPALRDGQPVPARVTLRLIWRLES
ncbi:MAG: energy transducer TonB [Planctomycetes bacterium]|nr:energy transducer TonB [Planctomycetota bacterium]